MFLGVSLIITFFIIYFVVTLPTFLLLNKIKVIKKIPIFFHVVSGLIVTGFLQAGLMQCSNTLTKNRSYEETAGLYRIDLTRTDLKSYRDDSLHFKQLQLKLTQAGTFTFNMSVPFISDSTGTWIAAGNGDGEWHEMYGKSGEFPFCQFASGDSILELNSVSPQKDREPVYHMFFKRIHKK